jgi:Na+/melibiose symporter-like transporter
MTDASQRIPLFEKIGYSAADAAANFVFLTMVLFQANFYTDVMGLAAGSAALIVLIARLWDAFFDPIMGITADRTRTRWGSFRPWVLITALPWGIIMYLAYKTPQGWSGGALFAYALITNIFLMTIYSANNMPYAALGGVMTGDTQERSKLNAFRFVAVNIAQFIVGGFTLIWVAKFAGQPTAAMPKGDTAKGWESIMGVYAVICVVFFVITFATTKERIKPTVQAKGSIKQDFADLLKNGPWVVMFFMTLIHFAILPLRGSANYNYYTKYADRGALYNMIEPLGLTAKLSMFNAGTVDATNNTIGLEATGLLSSGQKVAYRHGFDNSEGVGGLTNGRSYYVRVENGKARFYDREENALGSGDKGLVKLKEVKDLQDDARLYKGKKDASLKAGDVDVADNAIVSPAALELKTGDKVSFRYQVDVGGLVDGGFYYSHVGADGKVKLYDTKDNALAGGTAGLVQIKNTGTGTQHELIPQTLAEYCGIIVHGDPKKDLEHSTVADVAFGLQSMLDKVIVIIAIIFAPALAKKFGKKAIVVAGAALVTFNGIGFYFVPKDGVGMMMLLTVTHALFYGFTVPLLWAIFADVVDYNEWKTGRRATGIVFATIGFALKAGLALGTSAFLWIMAANNYDLDASSPAVVEAVRKSMTIYSSVLFGACTILLAMYKLNKKMTLQMASELAERRKSAAAQA